MRFRELDTSKLDFPDVTSNDSPNGPRKVDEDPSIRTLLGELVRNRGFMLLVVWVALAIWTLLLSVGTSLYAPAPGAPGQPTVDWRRGAMVFVFVGGFQALWMWLATRYRLPRRFRHSLSIADHRQASVEDGQEEHGQQSNKDS